MKEKVAIDQNKYIPKTSPGIKYMGNNSYKITVYTGLVQNGSRQRHTETIKGLTAAKKRRRELLATVDKGASIPTGKMTLADHLHQWMESYVVANCSQRTFDGYEVIVEKHLIPELGRIQLKNLSPRDIQLFYGRSAQKISRRTGEQLSNRTIHHFHRCLSQSLKYAVRQGYLNRNPCELVDPPKPRKKAMRTLDPSELAALLDAAKSNRFYPAIYTAVNTGLRLAELLGLRWRDVDPDITVSISVNRVLYKRKGVCIFKEPKTERSRRQVAMTPKLAIFLRQYKKECQRLFERLGKPLTLDELVFFNHNGEAIDPSVLSSNFRKIVKAAGLSSIRFHDLRHTFASLTLLSGAPPKVISEALGHSSVAFTMDVYSHIIPGMQEEAMAKLNSVIPSGETISLEINTILTPLLDIKTGYD
ncbi:MAG: site-specific integrase [Dehalococcoidales bacterium]